MKLINLSVLLLFCFFIAEFNSTIFAKSSNTYKEANVKKINIYAEEDKIFELINKEREKRGLDSLNWNSELANLARNYSIKMARENFFSHFDKNGDSIADRAKALKITSWRRIGENLFMSQGYEQFSQVAVRGWMKSSGHRKNILEEDYNQTGIGIARSRNGMIYVTQVFLQK